MQRNREINDTHTQTLSLSFPAPFSLFFSVSASVCLSVSLSSYLCFALSTFFPLEKSSWALYWFLNVILDLENFGGGPVKKTLPEAQRTQGIDSKTWVNLSARIVQNWFQCLYLNWWQVWPLVFDYKFGHLVALLASATNLVTRECHLHQLKVGSTSGTTYISLIWSSGGATCISSKVVH